MKRELIAGLLVSIAAVVFFVNHQGGSRKPDNKKFTESRVGESGNKFIESYIPVAGGRGFRVYEYMDGTLKVPSEYLYNSSSNKNDEARQLRACWPSFDFLQACDETGIKDGLWIQLQVNYTGEQKITSYDETAAMFWGEQCSRRESRYPDLKLYECERQNYYIGSSSTLNDKGVTIFACAKEPVTSPFSKREELTRMQCGFTFYVGKNLKVGVRFEQSLLNEWKALAAKSFEFIKSLRVSN